MASFFVEVALFSNKITIAGLGGGAKCIFADALTRHLDRNGNAYEWSDAETLRVDSGTQFMEWLERFLAGNCIQVRRVSRTVIIIGPFTQRSFNRARGRLAKPVLQVVETAQSAVV